MSNGSLSFIPAQKGYWEVIKKCGRKRGDRFGRRVQPHGRNVNDTGCIQQGYRERNKILTAIIKNAPPSGGLFYGKSTKVLPERLGGHQVNCLLNGDICPQNDNTTGRLLAVNHKPYKTMLVFTTLLDFGLPIGQEYENLSVPTAQVDFFHI